jgi:hypothetical protein
MGQEGHKQRRLYPLFKDTTLEELGKIKTSLIEVRFITDCFNPYTSITAAACCYYYKGIGLSVVIFQPQLPDSLFKVRPWFLEPLIYTSSTKNRTLGMTEFLDFVRRPRF